MSTLDISNYELSWIKETKFEISKKILHNSYVDFLDCCKNVFKIPENVYLKNEASYCPSLTTNSNKFSERFI